MSALSFQADSSGLSKFAASRAGVLAACLCVLALDLVLFWRALELYFIQDDFWYLWITSDQSISGLAKLFTTQNVFYRPISNFLYFFWGGNGHLTCLYLRLSV